MTTTSTTTTEEADISRAPSPASTLMLALPKGRMQEGVLRLLRDAGIDVRLDDRTYRPTIGIDAVDAKMLKPQNIIEMLDAGTRDLGFAGADWVAELDADVVEVLDTGLDPVRIVAAAPREMIDESGKIAASPLRIATEYVRLAERWVDERSLDARIIRSFGATEVFPPEDADCIIDNTATGSTLRANGLGVVDVLCESSTRLYTSAAALRDDAKRRRIDEIVLLLQSVLEARSRVMLEANVDAESLDALVEVIPCMQEPTVAPLHGSKAFAVKAAVPRAELATLIPQLKRLGGRDIIVTQTSQIVA